MSQLLRSYDEITATRYTRSTLLELKNIPIALTVHVSTVSPTVFIVKKCNTGQTYGKCVGNMRVTHIHKAYML